MVFDYVVDADDSDAAGESGGCKDPFLGAFVLEDEDADATTTDKVPRQIPPGKRSAGTYGWLRLLPNIVVMF